MEKHLVICIGRQFGSGGREIGLGLAKKLGIRFYDKEILKKAAEESGIVEELFEKADEKPTNSFLYDLYTTVATPSVPDQVFIAQAKVIKAAAARESCVIVGRCADYILREEPHVLKVFVNAPLDQRIKRAREEYGVTEPNLESYVIRQDKARASYYNYFATGRWGQSREYDLCVNSRIGIDTAVKVIKAAAQAMLDAE